MDASVLQEEAGGLKVGNRETGAGLGDGLVVMGCGGLEIGWSGGSIGCVAAGTDEVVEEPAVEC